VPTDPVAYATCSDVNLNYIGAQITCPQLNIITGGVCQKTVEQALLAVRAQYPEMLNTYMDMMYREEYSTTVMVNFAKVKDVVIGPKWCPVTCQKCPAGSKPSQTALVTSDASMFDTSYRFFMVAAMMLLMINM